MFENVKVIEINGNNLNLQKNKMFISFYSAAIAEYVKIFKKKGINQWQNNYVERNNPDNIRDELSKDTAKCLIVFLEHENFIGALKLSDTENQGFWHNLKFEKNNIKYITGLVTEPKLKGNGVGCAIMQALGKYATKKRIKKLRLDCRSENDFLYNYYTKHGFKIIGKGYKSSTNYKYTLFEASPKDIN